MQIINMVTVSGIIAAVIIVILKHSTMTNENYLVLGIIIAITIIARFMAKSVDSTIRNP